VQEKKLSLGRFTPRTSHSTLCTGGWVGSRDNMDGCGEENISCPNRDSSPEPSSL